MRKIKILESNDFKIVNKQLDKDNWLNFAASQFANTMATKKPEIKFENKEIQMLWDTFTKINKLVSANYKIVFESAKKGEIALGIKKYGEDLLLLTAEIISKEYIGNKLVKLEIIIDESENNFIVEKWDLTNGNQFVKRFAIDKLTNQETTLNSIKYTKSKEQELMKELFIPFTIFKSNPHSFSELWNVPDSIFKDFTTHIELLKTDSLTAKSLYVLNSTKTGLASDKIREFKEILNDPKATLFDTPGIFSILSNGGLELYSGMFNGQGIIEKLKYFTNQINKFGFLKIQTNDMGTKNMMSSETELLNSDADDYVELKANMFEEQWTELVEIWLKISNLEFEKFDVECIGSTKFLQNQQNSYLQNQQGISSNHFQPNNNNFQKNNNTEKEHS